MTDQGHGLDSMSMLTVDEVAKLLACSGRHVYRLVDAGHMPAPVRLGRAVRWPRIAIETWIIEGCPNLRKESK